MPARLDIKRRYPGATRLASRHRAEWAPTAPVLDARPHTPATDVASHLSGRSPFTVFALAMLGGYLALVGLILGLGLLLVDVLTPVYAIGHTDEAVNVWLAQHRSGSLNDASFVGSSIGDVPVLPVLVAIVVVGAAALRHWRVAGFILGSILLEVATYRVASLVVHRQRPHVVRLDQLPGNQSFPSGHVAASVAVYGALALIVTSRWQQRRPVVVAAWTAAVLLPIVVASARMYRGMHHPLDVMSGMVVGLLSIAVALCATRAADAAESARGHSRARS